MDGPSKVKSRRTHRKSRGGCQNCKRRRIKCDESKPCCGNCSKHSTFCSFANDPATDMINTTLTGAVELGMRFIVSGGFKDIDGIVASTPSVATPGTPWTFGQPSDAVQAPFDVSFKDLQLLHHYMVSTSRLFGNSEENLKFWQRDVPEMSFRHESLLPLLLAFAAYHRASVDFNGRDALTARAKELFNAGMRAQAAAVAHLDQAPPVALYLGAVLMSLCSFSAGPKPGDYLGFADDVDESSTFSVLARGVRAIIVHTDEVRAVQILSYSDTLVADRHAEVLQAMDAREQPPAHYTALQKLKGFLMEEAVTLREQDALVYAEESLKLEQIYSNVVKQDEPRTEQMANQYAHIVLAWLYRVSDEYMVLLQKKQSPALIIFAHFATLMKYLDALWILKGWPEHVMAGIYANVPEVHRKWLEWPMEQIGWSPR